MQSRPTTPSRCPTPTCLTSSDRASPQLVRHSLVRTSQGVRQRWRCKGCRRTFNPRTGSPYHRLRSSQAQFDRAIHMIVEGSSKSAVARVVRVSSSTVTRGLSRAAAHAGSFTNRTVREIEPRELQADEVRGYAADRDNRQFVFTAIEVWARLWLSTQVGGRTRRNCRLLARDARARCAFGQPRVLIVTDRFKYYAPEFRRAWSLTCVHVESGKIIRRGRVIRVRNKLVTGTQWQLDAARARSEDSKKLNTAYVERLNLFIRRGLACMQRRTNSAAKSSKALLEAVTLLQCYYNFIRPHSSLKFGRHVRTPAQQAGLVSRRLSWQDVFLSMRPMARVPWLVNPRVRAEWGGGCGGSNS